MLTVLVVAVLTALPIRLWGRGLVLSPNDLVFFEKMLKQQILKTKRDIFFAICFLLVAIHDNQVETVS